jgi:hypothetical protein
VHVGRVLVKLSVLFFAHKSKHVLGGEGYEGHGETHRTPMFCF